MDMALEIDSFAHDFFQDVVSESEVAGKLQ